MFTKSQLSSGAALCLPDVPVALEMAQYWFLFAQQGYSHFMDEETKAHLNALPSVTEL